MHQYGQVRKGKELDVRKEFPTVDTYGLVDENGQAHLSGGPRNAPYGTDNYATPAFGIYRQTESGRPSLGMM
jgi:hypothetical protein